MLYTKPDNIKILNKLDCQIALTEEEYLSLTNKRVNDTNAIFPNGHNADLELDGMFEYLPDSWSDQEKITDVRGNIYYMLPIRVTTGEEYVTVPCYIGMSEKEILKDYREYMICKTPEKTGQLLAECNDSEIKETIFAFTDIDLDENFWKTLFPVYLDEIYLSESFCSYIKEKEENMER